MPTIYVPPGSRVTIRTGPSKARIAAAILGEALVEAANDRDRARAERDKARWLRAGNSFAIGDVVGRNFRYDDEKSVHGEVFHLGDPGPNESIGVHYFGRPGGHTHLAERFHRASYFERRECKFSCCSNWNSLSLVERIRKRNQLLREI